jgi:hypothetical protein
MAAALSASASRVSVRAQVSGNTKVVVASPCVVVRKFQRGRFSVVSCVAAATRSGDGPCMHTGCVAMLQVLTEFFLCRLSAVLLPMWPPRSRRSGKSACTVPVSLGTATERHACILLLASMTLKYYVHCSCNCCAAPGSHSAAAAAAVAAPQPQNA